MKNYLSALVLLLGTAQAYANSGGTEVALTKKNVLVHLLNSKNLSTLVAGHDQLKLTDFRSVSVQKEVVDKTTNFTLFMEYENAATLRDLNCTFEAHVNVKSLGPLAELPPPTFGEVSCEE